MTDGAPIHKAAMSGAEFLARHGKTNGAAGDASTWPEPLDIIGAPELVGWPEITADCLPDPLLRYVTAEAERLNVDPVPLAGHVLAACSASISDAWRVKPKQYDHWTQQARLWVCVVKDVGQRGTEMIRSAFWPVKERDANAYKQWKREHAAWSARQAKRKKNDSADDDPEPRLRRFTTSDATIEAASQILADASDPHAKLTIIAGELTSFLGSFGRYTPNGAAARAQWLESFDGGPQRIDRIKRGHIYVPNWSLVNAGNIQPRRLAGILAHRAEYITASEIGRAYRPLRGKPAGIGEAMAVLNDAGWTRPVESRHDGARWAINPAAYKVFAAAAAAERDRRAQVRQAIKTQVADFVVDARPEDLADLLQQGLSIEAAATQLGISRATAYRWRPRAKV